MKRYALKLNDIKRFANVKLVSGASYNKKWSSVEFSDCIQLMKCAKKMEKLGHVYDSKVEIDDMSTNPETFTITWTYRT